MIKRQEESVRVVLARARTISKPRSKTLQAQVMARDVCCPLLEKMSIIF
jgi:hypothetical protein